MLINYISIKQTIGRFLKELGIEETTYIDDIPQWVEDAIQIIGVPNYYVYRFKNVKIENGRCAIPCDIENLHGVWVSNSLVEVPRKGNIYDLPIKNAQMIGGLGVQTEGHTSAFGTINGRHLQASFDKGYAFFAYTGVPLDCDGYPLIPKDAHLNEALQYYFIMKMSLSGYKHPVLGYADAMQLWEKHYPRAGNSINWMDLNDYQEFTSMWNNILLGDLSANNYIV